MTLDSTLASPAEGANDLEKSPFEKTTAIHNITTHDDHADRKENAIAIEAGVDPHIVYPSGLQLIFITIALCLAVFCMALDNTIIATAIPKITDQFKSIQDVGWYGSSYLLTTCALQLFFGKLYSFFSIKWIFLSALGIFELGSLICGAAPNSPALIVGRAVAGIGSAGIFAGAILIIAATVPLAKRPLYMGLIGGMYGLASVVGPLLGGAFTDHATWRWCFYINLPIGAITVVFIFFYYHPAAAVRQTPFTQMTWKQRATTFDILGTSVFLPMVICLLLALQWGGSTYAWGNARIIALFIVFGLLLVVFILVQWKAGDNATVPFRIIRQRSVAATAFFTLSLGGAFFVFVYYVPIWFQAIKSVSALKSGIMSIPLVLSLVLMSLIAGAFVQTVGYYAPPMLLSSVLMAIGAGLISTWTPETGHAKWIGYQVIFGAGTGAGMQQAIIVIQRELADVDIAVGTAVIMLMQLLGGAVMISVAQNIFSNELVKNIKSIVPNLDPSVVLHTGATELKTAVGKGDIAGVLKAYNGALVSVYYVSVAMASISIFGSALVKWKSVKGKNMMGVAA